MKDTLNRFLFGKHLEDDEVLSAVFHAHWFMGGRVLFLPAMSSLLSLSLFVLSAVRQTSEPIVVILAAWAVLSFVWLLRSFFDYYLDAWLVTDKGIIDLEWHGWFHRESSRVLYSDIQGVSYEIQGILGTMLGFGTVSVEKISTGSAISLAFVPRPQSVESIILRNMEAYLHTKNMKDSRHVQEVLAGIVSQNVQLSELTPKSKAAVDPAAPPVKKRQPFQAKKI